MNKSYKNIDEMLIDIKKEQKAHPIKNFFFTIQCKLKKWFINNPRDLKNNIKWFIQRGKRGYSDSDLWDFDSYLAEIISKGLKEFSEEIHGVPDDIAKKFKDEDKELIESVKEWKRILLEISWTFENTDLIDRVEYDKEVLKRYNNGWRLFKKYFYHLWD